MYDIAHNITKGLHCVLFLYIVQPIHSLKRVLSKQVSLAFMIKC